MACFFFCPGVCLCVMQFAVFWCFSNATMPGTHPHSTMLLTWAGWNRRIPPPYCHETLTGPHLRQRDGYPSTPPVPSCGTSFINHPTFTGVSSIIPLSSAFYHLCRLTENEIPTPSSILLNPPSTFPHKTTASIESAAGLN